MAPLRIIAVFTEPVYGSEIGTPSMRTTIWRSASPRVESFASPREFVRELKRKAGLADWSQRVECFRYRVESFPAS